MKWEVLKKLINTEEEQRGKKKITIFATNLLNMNSLFYAIADFFEFLFQFMPTVGNATNLLFIGLITFFTIYWIREMKNNPDKARH
jgi:hypothetical protein